jgi:hypothetical protein
MVTPDLHVGTFDLVDSKILVRVKLNDTLDARMVIDCGAAYSFLSSEAAEALQIPLREAMFRKRMQCLHTPSAASC